MSKNRLTFNDACCLSYFLFPFLLLDFLLDYIHITFLSLVLSFVFLRVRYTKPYTINGLDSETSSTLPALYDVVLLDGAAWQACLVRAAGRIETINLNQDVSVNFARMAEHLRQAYELVLPNFGSRRFPRSACTNAAGTGETLTHGWDDQWPVNGNLFRVFCFSFV